MRGADAARRYGAAVAFTGAAILLAAGALHVVGLPLFVVFLAAVAASHVYGGVGPALLSAALSSAVTVYAFVPPYLSWTVERSPWHLPIAYAAVIVVIALVRAHRIGDRG